MAGQTTDSGLIAQAIGRYFSYRLLVIPAVALLMVMTAYFALRGNRVYAVGTSHNEVKLGQESLATGVQQGEDFALDTREASTPRGGGQQVSSYAIQGNDEDDDVAGSPEGYSNATAMTASYTEWGGEDNGILSAFIGHLKKTLPEPRVQSAANHMVLGASEA